MTAVLENGMFVSQICMILILMFKSHLPLVSLLSALASLSVLV